MLPSIPVSKPGVAQAPMKSGWPSCKARGLLAPGPHPLFTSPVGKLAPESTCTITAMRRHKTATKEQQRDAEMPKGEVQNKNNKATVRSPMPARRQMNTNVDKMNCREAQTHTK